MVQTSETVPRSRIEEAILELIEQRARTLRRLGPFRRLPPKEAYENCIRVATNYTRRQKDIESNPEVILLLQNLSDHV